MFTMTSSHHSVATVSSRKLSFIALDGTAEGLTEVAAWEEGKIQTETKNKVDAVAQAHGEPISHLPADWESIVKGFKQKHGANIPTASAGPLTFITKTWKSFLAAVTPSSVRVALIVAMLMSGLATGFSAPVNSAGTCVDRIDT